MDTAKKRIAVLFHKNDRFRNLGRYSVYHVARYWRQAGHEVIFLFGTRRFVPADLVLVHVNLSVVPEKYLTFARRYPIVLNGLVKDIRKRTFSENILAKDANWDGPVIVKSDLNYAGYPERTLKRSRLARRFPVVRRVRRLLDRLTGRTPRFAESTDYELYDKLADVPEGYFDDTDLVVEKFLPEIRDGLYHTRNYNFLGDRAQWVNLAGPNPIVKAATCVKIDEIEPHGKIVEIRRRLNLDYGKLDYVVHDGRVVLLDVNKTIGAGARDIEDVEGRLKFRSEGLYYYFRSAGSESAPGPPTLP